MNDRFTLSVLDHGSVRLANLAGPVRRPNRDFDADDIDPALAARMSFDGGLEPRARELDLKLCDYLMKNRHTTPFEMIECWIEMEMPIFVARQFVRHRTAAINEVSARYVTLPEKWYIPDIRIIGAKPKSVKQGRVIGSEPTLEQKLFACNLNSHCQNGYDQYKMAIADEIPNELARCFLSLNHYTHWLWKQDLHNIMGFLSLRVHGHAQYEAREYGEAVLQLLTSSLPESMELFNRYRRMSG